MRARALFLTVLLMAIAACGASPSASSHHAAPSNPATSHEVSARFQSVAGATPIVASGSGGAPIAVASVSPQAGFVLERAGNFGGVGGALLRTNDGGASWTVLPLPAGLVYDGLYANSSSNVVVWAETPACVAEGHACVAEVLRSRDGGGRFAVVLKASGLMWTAARHYGTRGLWLEASSANCYSGCVPATTLYTSANGGATWIEAGSGSQLPNFVALWTNNGTSAYGLDAQAVYQSQDGGRRWTLLSKLPTPGGQGSFVAVGGTIEVPAPGVLDISTCNGAAAGDGGCPISVFQSTDGGHSFRDVLNWGGTQDGVLHMLTAKTGAVIMMGTTGGNTLPGQPRTNLAVTTQNAFATTVVSARLPLNADAVSFRSAERGWAVGSPTGCIWGPAADTCPVALARTTNGGATWSLVNTAPGPTEAVDHAAPHVWWGLGTASSPLAVLASQNGTTWRVVGAIPAAAASGGCGTVAIAFPSVSVGYAVNGASLFRTGDGGRHWDLLPGVPQNIDNVWFSSASEGVVLAGRCTQSLAALYATRDGGIHWSRVGQLPSNTLTAVFRSPEVGYALQGRTRPKEVRLLKTTDAGRSWRPVAVHIPVSGSGLAVLPNHTVVVQTLGSLVVIQSDRVTFTVALQGSAARALVLGGIVPVGVAPRLEVFVPGEGLWSSPWGPHMVLRESAG